MSDDEINKMLDRAYDEARESSIWEMVSDFYSRKMLSVVIVVWLNALIAIGLGIFSAVAFFRSETVGDQIMYAALFVCAGQWLAVAKIFAWQAVHKNSIKREVKRLEIRIGELAKTVRQGAAE